MKKFLTALCCLGLFGSASAQFNIDGRVQTINNPSNLSSSRDNSSPNGSVTNSSVNINGGSLNNFSATGGATIGQNATGNSVSVTGTTGTNVSLVGGDSDSPDTILPSGVASNNSVNITDATITNPTSGSNTKDIIGGRADGNQANGNSVNIHNSSVTSGTVYGAYSELGKNFGFPADEEDPLAETFDSTYNYNAASNNSINVTDSTVNAQLIGGFATDQSEVKTEGVANAVVSTAENNRVSLINSTVASTSKIPFYNSASDSADAVAAIGGNGGVYSNNNSVYVENSSVTGQLIGATTRSSWVRSENSDTIKSTANNNSVTVKGASSAVNGSVFGANSFRTNSSQNQVVITDGAQVTGNIAGAKSVYGVILDGTSTEDPKPEVLRGVATSHSNNTVIISGTADQKVTVTTATNTEPTYQLTNGFIAGSWNEAGNTEGNKVAISNAVINGSGHIMGGFVVNEAQSPAEGDTDSEVALKSIGHTAQNNTVAIADSTVNASIYGGYVMFKADANPDPENGPAEEERGVDRASGNTIALHNTQVTGDIYGGYVGDNNDETIYRGNKLVLSHYQGTLGEYKNFQETSIIGNDSNITFAPSQQVFATFELNGKPQVETTVIANTSADSQIVMEQSSLGAYEYTLKEEVNGSGLDWVLTGGFSQTNAKPYAQAALAGLALTTAGDDSLSEVISTAFEANDENNTFLTGEYGDTKYKTGSGFNMYTAVAQAGMYHKFTDSTLAGFFGQYAYGDYDTFPKRADGKVNSYAGGLFAAWNYSETGRLEVQGRFGTQETKFNSSALQSNFKYDALYWGIGGGFVEDFGWLDVYGRLSYARKDKESKTDNLGQDLTFDAMQSLVGKFGADYELPFMLWHFQPIVGAAGIYEFDGESKTSLDGHKIDDASLKGLTGEGKISFTYDASDSMVPVKTALSVFGLVGQMQGWGASVKIMGRF
ncbi:autotransporter domain-containing protein [Candidatus Avelusimicrobium alvi]|uniref:autotransporter domain-containing protein n=1 Tax=Candidatus Avelusimicrobium alvi TaxID=3416221 RepID=UPI003D0E4DEC